MSPKKATSKTSVEKYCGIGSYVKAKDTQLSELFDSLCIAQDLRPNRTYNGLTFIMPGSKTVAAWKKAYRTTPEEVIYMMRMHVISDYIPDAKTFFAKKDDIPNRLGDRVPVVAGASKGVAIYDGVEIEPVEDAAIFAINTKYAINQAIWQIKGSAEIKKQSSPVRATNVHALKQKFTEKKTTTPTKGGYEDFKTFDVNKFVDQTLQVYLNTRAWKVRVGDDTPLFRNECLENTVSLMLWLRQNSSDVYTRLATEYTPDPVANMLILFKMVPDNLLSEWYSSRIPIDTMVTKHASLAAAFSTKIEYSSPTSITTMREVMALYTKTFGVDGYKRLCRDMALYYSMMELQPCEAGVINAPRDKQMHPMFVEFKGMIDTVNRFLQGRVSISITATKDTIDQASLIEYPEWKAFIGGFVKTMLNAKGIEQYRSRTLAHVSGTASNTAVNYKKMIAFITNVGAVAGGCSMSEGAGEQTFRERLVAKAAETSKKMKDTASATQQRAENAAFNATSDVMDASAATAAKAADMAATVGETTLNAATGTVKSVITL